MSVDAPAVIHLPVGTATPVDRFQTSFPPKLCNDRDDLGLREAVRRWSREPDPE